MSYDTELNTYIGTLDTTIHNIDDLVYNLVFLADNISEVSSFVGTVDDIGDTASEMRELIDDQLRILKLTKQAGPLSTASSIYETALKLVLPVVEQIEKAVDTLNGKQDTGKDGEEDEGEFLSDLTDALDYASGQLYDFAGDLTGTSDGLAVTRKSMAAMQDALTYAVDPAYDSLKSDIEDQVAARNAAAEPLADIFNCLTSAPVGQI